MNNEERILELLTQMQSDIAGMQQGQKETNSCLSSLEDGQKQLQYDVKDIKENVDAIWEYISRNSNQLNKHEEILSKNAV